MKKTPSSTQILSLMINAAEESAKIIRANFRQSDQYQDKSSHLDIVTATDLASQNSIHDILKSGMIKLGINESDIGFIEEECKTDLVKHHTFIVDPIDGTTNFASGIPFSCISIGYAVDRNMQLGVVLEPFSKTLYWGEVGQGSFVRDILRGEQRLLTSVKPAKSWIVGAHLNALDVVAEQFASYQKIYPHVRGMRNIGSLTLDLCFMADNVIDAVLNQGCYVWDLAAVSVILHEAGGALYDYQGIPLQFDWTESKKKYQVIACHPEIKEDLLKLMQ